MKKPPATPLTRDASITVADRAAREPAFAEALLEEAVILSNEEPEIARRIVQCVGSITPATALLNQMLVAAPGPRMLTPSEQDLLRQSKKEVGERSRVRIQNRNAARK